MHDLIAILMDMTLPVTTILADLGPSIMVLLIDVTPS